MTRRIGLGLRRCSHQFFFIMKRLPFQKYCIKTNKHRRGRSFIVTFNGKNTVNSIIFRCRHQHTESLDVESGNKLNSIFGETHFSKVLRCVRDRHHWRQRPVLSAIKKTRVMSAVVCVPRSSEAEIRAFGTVDQSDFRFKRGSEEMSIKGIGKHPRERFGRESESM